MNEALRTAGALAWSVVERVLVRPVREGRLRVRGPRGYTAQVVLGTVGIALALAVALLAPTLRDRLLLTPSTVGIDAPSALVGPLLALLVLAVALVHTAALHARLWGRLAGMAVALVYLSSVADRGYHASPTIALTAAAIALVLLAALQVLRWRARTAWWELPLLIAIYAGATGLTLAGTVRAGVGTGAGGEIDALWWVMANVAYFAAPVIWVASLAVAQLGLRGAAWTVRGVRVLTPGWLALTLCVVVLGFRVVVDVVGWLDTWAGSGTRIAGAAALLAAAALAWGAVSWVGRRYPQPVLRGLSGDLTVIALPLALTVVVGALLQLLVAAPTALLSTVATDVGLPGLAAAATATGAAVGAISAALASGAAAAIVVAALLLAALWLATHGWRGPSTFVAVLAIVFGANAWWGLEVPLFYLPVVLTALTVLALVVPLMLRRLTVRRVEAVTLLGLLTTLLQVRDVLGQPLMLVLGTTAAVLASMVWAFLTGGAATADPQGRRGRAAWFLGYTLLGFTAVAFAALAANPTATLDAERLSAQGDELFGTAILLTAIVACFVAVVRDRDLGELG